MLQVFELRSRGQASAARLSINSRSFCLGKNDSSDSTVVPSPDSRIGKEKKREVLDCSTTTVGIAAAAAAGKSSDQTFGWVVQAAVEVG